MQDQFEISMVSELNYFLRLQIKQTHEGICLSQMKYVRDLIKWFGMDNIKPTNTSMCTTTKLDKGESSKSIDTKLYRGIYDR